MGEIETRIRVVRELGSDTKYYPEQRMRVSWLPIVHHDNIFFLTERQAKEVIDEFLKYKSLPREEIIGYPKPIPPGDE